MSKRQPPTGRYFAKKVYKKRRVIPPARNPCTNTEPDAAPVCEPSPPEVQHQSIEQPETINLEDESCISIALDSLSKPRSSFNKQRPKRLSDTIGDWLTPMPILVESPIPPAQPCAASIPVMSRTNVHGQRGAAPPPPPPLPERPSRTANAPVVSYTPRTNCVVPGFASCFCFLIVFLCFSRRLLRLFVSSLFCVFASLVLVYRSLFFRNALSAVLDEMRCALPTDTDENKKNPPPSTGAGDATAPPPSRASNQDDPMSVDNPATPKRSRRRRRKAGTPGSLTKVMRNLTIEEEMKIVDHLKSKLRRLGYAVLSELHEGYAQVRGRRLSKITLGVDGQKMLLQMRQKGQAARQDVVPGRRRRQSSSSASQPNKESATATAAAPRSSK